MTMEENQSPENLKVKFTPTASQEVKDIIRQLAKESPKAAQNVREALVTKTKQVLTLNPFLGRPLYEYPEYEKKGVRRYLPLAHYSILYFVTNDTVEIWHVWDNRRNWTTLFED
ncbi:MAG TPA: type II toxin-antitoxin system RelE/ParE family toxin [Methylomusa anaerophila]|uniref:Plasmid stabilisation system protein n=1 Tax=Methylomusa anaerophila TaxID=1930071 RepID=A0A348AMG1_9FIRM|nr:type II toxin-antitoxin system RelE/ParE family toxin [Methylomusa anaerophila]BBB92259.1 plasmid stabilisation system protein [Methylomusa anaerophila]HML90282.1 type II toxin-antitoxin system RelE/ParE family toxin [Methylomusa anaerophila]